MSISDLFSKRQRRLRGEVPDVYEFDQLSTEFRVQVIHILGDTIGTDQKQYNGRLSSTGEAYQFIVTTLRREYGVFCLVKDVHRENYLAELSAFLLGETDIERVLDGVEWSFKLVNTFVRSGEIYGKAARNADEAIEELNGRFKEHGIGYQYVGGQIIRVDSELVHAEVVQPVLKLLHDPKFAGAEGEFYTAHSHYRNGRHKEALVECLKSLESTLKTICDLRSWQYDPKATCKDLLDVCFAHNLIPNFWSAHFSALRSTLESGVPTARNRMGGHGQGQTVINVPSHVASYVIHLTATAIKFLVESEKSVP